MIWFRRSIIALGVIVLLIVISIGLLATLDLSRFKGFVEEQVSEITGRELVIGGDFRPEFGRTLTLVAEDIRLSNAAWGKNDNILAIGRVQIAVDLWSLIDRPIRIENFELDDVSIIVEVHPETAQSVWQFSDAGEFTEDVEVDDVSGFDPKNLPAILRQARIGNLSLQYGQGWLAETRTVDLEELSLGEGDKAVLDLSANGTIAGFAMRLRGSVGPLHGILKGEDITLDLGANLDDLEMSIRGRIEDLYTGSGADIELNLRGPNAEAYFAALGLPPVATGDIDLHARIRDDTEGIHMVAKGGIGNLIADVDGRIASWETIRDVQLAVNIEGPNLGAIGELFGADYLPQQGFSVRGGISSSGDRVSLDAISLKAGDASLIIDGAVNATQELGDALVTIDIHGPDISEFLPPLPGDKALTGAFTLTGSFESSPEGQQLLEVSGSIGNDRVLLTGTTGALPGFRGLDLRAQVYGPDLDTTVKPFTNADLPALSYDFSVRITASDATFALHDLSFRVGKNDLALDGLIGSIPDLDGMDAEISFSAPAFQTLIQTLDGFDSSAETLDVRGRISKRRGKILIHDIVLTSDALNRLQLDGSLGELPELNGLQLAVQADGPDATAFGMLETINLPAQPFKISGEISKTAEGWFVRDWTSVIGDDRWQIDGALGDGEDIAGIDVEIRVAGADLRDFLVNASEIDTAVPYSLTSRIAVDDEVIDVRNLEFLIGATTGTISGTIPISSELTDAEFEVHLAGSDLRRLGKNLRLGNLPDGPFGFDGKLSRSGAAYVVENLALTVADNDIGGNLTITPGERPAIEGSFKSKNLDLNQLIPPADDPVDNEDPSAVSDRVIPDITLPLEALELVNLDMVFEIGNLKTANIDFKNVESRVLLKDQTLSVTTTNIGLERGSLSGELRFSNVASEGRMYLKVSGRNVNLRPLVSNQGEPIDRPPADLDLELTAAGQNIRQLAATLNGTLQLTLGPGELDRSFSGFLMNDLISQIATTINPLAKGETNANLECGVMNIQFIDGVATVNPVALQSDELAIASLGSIDFGTEAVNLSIRTKVRKGIGISVTSVVSPYLRVGGTLGRPAMQIDKKRGFISGSVAFLSGGLSIWAKGAWDAYLSSDNMCAAISADIESGAIGDETE